MGHTTVKTSTNALDHVHQPLAKPATEKQKALLFKLGYRDAADPLSALTIDRASDLIEAYKRRFEAVIAQAKRTAESINLADVAGRRVTLGRESAREWSGPCPKCGGRDRFHVKEDAFFCRKCHPEWGDYIEYLVWADNKDFLTVCTDLAGGSVPDVTGPIIHPRAKEKKEQPANWQADAGEKVRNAYHLLHKSKHGEPGREYLTGRGLDPATWEAFELGFALKVSMPGTWDKEKGKHSYPKQPAIVMPWYEAGRLVAVRYRFLERHTYTDIDGKEREDVKQKSVWESDFTGVLFGEQTHEPGASALVLCEGELNAASIWQATRGKGIDVLSLGSQDAKLTPAHIEQIARYSHVIAWLDEPQNTKKIMAVLPGVPGLQSKGLRGMDANDWLKAGKLEGLIAAALRQAGWTPSEPATVEASPLPDIRHHWPSVDEAEAWDRSYFVGLDMATDAWKVVQRRCWQGWQYITRSIDGGVYISEFRPVQ